MDYPYRVERLPDEDGGGFACTFPDLPGCMGDGETVDEAIADGQLAMEAWIDAAKEFGRDIPEPWSHQNDYSGKFLLRLPKSLHRKLAEQAKADDVSLNQTVLMLVSQALGERRTVE